MTRTLKITKGVGALALLTALLGFVPWALTHFVGWPLPHAIPSWSRLSSDLNQHGIPDTVLLKALACVVWVSWAILVVSAAVEIPAVLRGRTARRLPLAGSFQPLVGHLVAAILVAALAVMPRAAPGGPARLAATIPYGRPSQSAIVMALAADTAPVSDPTPAAAATLPVTRAATTYVVQRGDTLWGIAERQLGDPLRWREIFALNEGRIEPGGQAFTDPNWIYPGWDLELPTATTTAPAPAAPAPDLPAAPTVPGPGPSTPAVPTPTTGPTSTSTVPTTTPHLGAPTPNGHVPHHAPDGAQPVQLPSGSVVAGSFAAGVLSAMAIGRLRRRHGYHFRPPRPGRDLGADPPRPTLHHLLDSTAAHDDSTDLREMDGGDVLPTGPFDETERRQHPGTLEIGTRDGAPVTVELTEVSGVALCGAGLDEIARALVCGLLVRAGPGAAHVLLTAEVGEQLLPGLADPAIRHANNEAEAARAVEAERIARIRRLSSVDASDANQFRLDNPENPLPLLLVVLDALPDASLGRWTALLGDCARLGIVVVFLTDSPAATARLAVNPVRTVVDAPEHLSDRVVGAQLYGMRADEAVELLGSTTLLRHESSDASELTPSDEPWPQITPADGPDRADRALRVEVLGPQRITAFGETVTRGLRNRAKTLLAWYLLRPEGATSEQAVDALWPDTPPERVLKQFWYALGDLRSFFQGPEDESLDVLEKIGDHYRPSPAEISCDLWEFQSALAEAARTDNNYDHVRAALRRAVDAYRGDLLAGTDHLWIEPARQDLHRRAVDAHLRLAELEDHAGQPDAAVEVLERVVELDRYAEEPYRRLMTLQAGLGRLDAVSATWQMLHRRLAELDLEVDEATVRLYRSLVDDSSPRAAVQQIRLSS